jgi:hypothetical protein
VDRVTGQHRPDAPRGKREPEQHGQTGTPEYIAWANMLQRCHNPRNPTYARYGACGVVVCDNWRRSFTAFLEDVGPRPTRRHTLDRIDNEGNYEPGNVRWATWKVQSNNRRPRGTVDCGCEEAA